MQSGDGSEAMYSTNTVTENFTADLNTYAFVLTSVVHYVCMIQLLCRRTETSNAQ